MSNKLAAGSMALLFAAVVVNFGLDWMRRTGFERERAALLADNERFKGETSAFLAQANGMLSRATETANKAETAFVATMESANLVKAALEGMQKKDANEDGNEDQSEPIYKIVEIDPLKAAPYLPAGVFDLPIETIMGDLTSIPRGSTFSKQFNKFDDTRPGTWDADGIIKELGEEFQVELTSEEADVVRAKMKSYGVACTTGWNKLQAYIREEGKKRFEAGDFDPVGPDGKVVIRTPYENKNVYSSGSGGVGVPGIRGNLRWDRYAHPEGYRLQMSTVHAIYTLVKDLRSTFEEKAAGK